MPGEDRRCDSATQHYEDLFKYAAEMKCDMIIVGQRGKPRIADWLLGSVSKRVSSYAPCTVTIVK